jgi:hypothetical protein
VSLVLVKIVQAGCAIGVNLVLQRMLKLIIGNEFYLEIPLTLEVREIPLLKESMG